MRRELERKLLPCLDERGMTWQHGLLRQRPGRQGGAAARARVGLFQRTENNRWLWCSLTAEAPPPPRAPYRNPRRRRCRRRYVIDFPILLSSRLIINCRLQCYHVCVHVSLNLIWWDVQTDGAPLPEEQTNKQTNKQERKKKKKSSHPNKKPTKNSTKK